MEKLFIDKDLTRQTLDWILNKKNRDSYLDLLEDNSRFHNFSSNEEEFINSLGLDYTSIEIVSQIILSHYDLDLDTPTSSFFHNRISWHPKKSEEKPIRSNNLIGKIAIRFNVLLQKPQKGGLAIINGEEYSPEVDEVWLEVRGVNRAGFTSVEGRKNMVLLSIEYHIDEEIAKEKGWLHPDCKAIESSPIWNKDNYYNEDKYYPYVSDIPKIDRNKFDEEEEEEKMERIKKLVEELYSEGTPPVRINQIRKMLGYAPKE